MTSKASNPTHAAAAKAKLKERGKSAPPEPGVRDGVQVTEAQKAGLETPTTQRSPQQCALLPCKFSFGEMVMIRFVITTTT